MPDPLFVYQAPGREWPEHIIVDQRNGLLRITIRGEPDVELGEDEYGPTRTLTEGPTAQMVLPSDATAGLIGGLLQMPLLPDMQDAKPFVLWFADDAERQAFLARLRELMPEIEERALDRRRAPR